MAKLKVLSVFGTRPEAIKMAPVIKELEKYPERVESVVCVTAQHRDMLDQVLDIFKIHPKYDLDIMKKNQTLSMVTNSVLNELGKVLDAEKPDVVLVHGDTTTTLATALTAFYRQVKIGHVEAGLRTYDKYSPFPEEINREFVGLVADYNFAPTRTAADNLLNEKKRPETIFVTGNTAIDALKTTTSNNYHNEILDSVGDDRMILVTVHRRESLGKPMKNIFRAIKRIADDFSDVKVVYPVHSNPKVRDLANEIFENDDNIKLIEPLDVVDFHNFMKKAYLVMTDSGGIQEEAPSLGKPVLVLREKTERPEGIEAGTLKLVGTKEERIYNETSKLLADKKMYKKMSETKNPYGDGMAAKRIVEILLNSCA
ncbi:UDP-N-acetylglucosamine 2-epimerase (non-hydrolyzing) [Candidatus Saccharibacteria bacterium]|nr:UDP-N-acetylglucosamine 2-epimerase (non-hydrolyzing) [Candidatus Saccharibacteria bacterium]